jgi:hypothetical protein
MPLHIADSETAQRASSAIRDILFLYRELTAYNGYSGDHDTGTFDPWEFVDSTGEEGWASPDDLNLLHEGSAVAILCWLGDEWSQGGGARA